VLKGKIILGNEEITNLSPRDIRNCGLSYVPEERMRDGAIGDFSVKENCVLIDHKSDDFSKFGFLKATKVSKHAEDIIEKFNVKTPSIETSTKSLSGGNIQKLIMARELSSSPKVLLAAQPTRGVDIGAAEYIHQRLIEQRDRGTAIILISEDLDEILALSDRVVVMFEGEIVADLDSAECSVSELGLLMGGVKHSGVIIDSKRTQ
ncbi:MAG: ATP-binding cassette domain-containing protein, partial [Actinomycetota bacterium]|nr:ATP-binding cassette domain-containing protein [Actinomycetota bacterium]